MRKTQVICDICGREQAEGLHWSTNIVHCDVDLPRDGVNGGDFSGDWCYRCRNSIHNAVLRLKGKEIPETYRPCGNWMPEVEIEELTRGEE